jgi:hypothetical protein
VPPGNSKSTVTGTRGSYHENNDFSPVCQNKNQAVYKTATLPVGAGLQNVHSSIQGDIHIISAEKYY